MSRDKDRFRQNIQDMQEAKREAAKAITPALTPKEWGIVEEEGGVDLTSPTEPRVSIDVRDDGLTLTQELSAIGIELRHRHLLAALALHDQPFGFTWEDVDLLRQIAADDKPSYDLRVADGGVIEAEKRLNALADRIASLLPPRS